MTVHAEARRRAPFRSRRAAENAEDASRGRECGPSIRSRDNANPSPRTRHLRVLCASARKTSSLRAPAPPRAPKLLAALTLAATLTACATQVPSAVQHTAATPGFLWGVWHGFIFPVAWVLSLLYPEVAIYAVPNTGGWYDFGFFLGIMVFGVGARHTRTVYVTRRRRR